MFFINPNRKEVDMIKNSRLLIQKMSELLLIKQKQQKINQKGIQRRPRRRPNKRIKEFRNYQKQLMWRNIDKELLINQD